MSFKQYIPVINNHWDSYWKNRNIEKEIELIKTDGLRPIFEKYLSRKKKILEAGCGLGKWVIYLTKKGYDIQGVDTNRFALEKCKNYYPKVQLKLADVLRLPFTGQNFDIYLSLGVVEHFEAGPHQALQEAYRVLKKGGMAIIEVPYASPLRHITVCWSRLMTFIKTPARKLLEIFGIRKRVKNRKVKFYEYRYTKQELVNFMKETGFVNIKIFPKDDLSKKRSIALWLDFPKLQKPGGELFKLNILGIFIKKILHTISPFLYSALIVAVADKE